MKHNHMFSLLLVVMALTACGGGAEPAGVAPQAAAGVTVAPEQTQQASSAEEAALAIMQKQFKLDGDQIRVLGVVEGEWPDACLGMPAPNEQCEQILTPGYVVTLEANGVLYIYNVDHTLTTVRLVAAPDA